MASVNLIPRSRYIAQKRTLRGRRWLVGAMAYIALLGAIHLALAVSGARTVNADDQIEALEAKTQSITNEVAALTAQLEQARSVLQAGRVLSDQPDWSILMALLAKTTQSRIALTEVVLNTGAGPDARNTAAAADSLTCRHAMHDYLLTVRGIARTQIDVAQFAMRLENTRLFDHVMMRKASRTTFAAEEATAFEIDCGLIDGKGAMP